MGPGFFNDVCTCVQSIWAIKWHHLKPLEISDIVTYQWQTHSHIIEIHRTLSGPSGPSGPSGTLISQVVAFSEHRSNWLFDKCDDVWIDVKHEKNMKTCFNVYKSYHEVPRSAMDMLAILPYLAIPCYFLPFLAISSLPVLPFCLFFSPDLTDFWEHCPLRCGKDDVGGCVLSTRRPKWNSRRTGRTGRTGHGQPVRLLHNLWGFQCDKMWQERNAVRFPELKNFRNVSAFLRFGGQAEDIDPRFPWPLQHGFREEFSIGGRVKGLRNDRVRLYPPNPFLLYDTRRKHEETRTFPTDKLKE